MRAGATIERELGRYAVGAKVRRLRLRKKISLVELGRHTGLSAALLSKLERGVVMPTLPTLVRIALVFGVGLDHFFGVEPRAIGIVRRGERLRFPQRPDDPTSSYEFESLDFNSEERQLNAFFAEFTSDGVDPQFHSHDCAEFVFVLNGRVRVHSADGVQVLDAGDSMYIAPGVEHGYSRDGDGSASAVVVTTADDRTG